MTSRRRKRLRAAARVDVLDRFDRLQRRGRQVDHASRREAVERQIESLRRRLGIKHKVDALRAGIELLEKEAERRERIRRWKRATVLAASTSREVNAGFRQHSRLGRI